MRNRILFPLLLLALPALLFAQTPVKPYHSPMKSKSPNAAAVHQSAIVIDTHADTPQRFLDEHFDLADPLGGGNLNLDSIHKGNLGAEFFSIWVEPTLYKGQYAHRTLELIDSVKQQVAKHPDQIEFVTSPEGIEQAHRDHKFAALMGIEGGHSIEDSIALLRQYYALGVRYMTLTWSNSNDWADSSGDIDDKSIPHTKEGLTEFGKDVVYEMNRLGMMVDISHVSDRTFYRTLVITRAPVIASHSVGARPVRRSPQHDRRHAPRRGQLRRARLQGRRGPGQLLLRLHLPGLPRRRRRPCSRRSTRPCRTLKDKAKAEGKEVTYAEMEKIAAQLRRPHSAPAALDAHRPHRPHRQGGRH